VCGPTSLANYTRLVTKGLTGTERVETIDTVYDLYRRSGNPNFDPRTGDDDNGVDMAVMLDAAIKGGFGGTKVLAHATADPANPDEMWAAVEIFGGVLLGVDLKVAQQAQTDQGLWDYKQSSEWGGHAILAGRYADKTGTLADRSGVITWARVVDMTDQFMARQLGEVHVVILEGHLGSKAFIEGVDLAALAADYKALTGRTFPAPQPTPQPPTPAPSPTPTPVPVRPDASDEAFARVAAPWSAERHVGENRRVAVAFEQWRKARGL